MTRITTHLTWALVALLAVPPHLYAQVVAGPDVWRTFIERLDPGTTLKVRLKSGPRFRATLLQVSADAMIVQPKTRAAVPPQQVSIADIETLEVDTARGAGLGKAVAIGAAVAAGVWLALMGLAFAVWAD
ncbi:MAG: hypothetical protein ACRD26_22075 [Vicinamibacterales bacterium]